MFFFHLFLQCVVKYTYAELWFVFVGFFFPSASQPTVLQGHSTD